VSEPLRRQLYPVALRLATSRRARGLLARPGDSLDRQTRASRTSRRASARKILLALHGENVHNPAVTAAGERPRSNQRP